MENKYIEIVHANGDFLEKNLKFPKFANIAKRILDLDNQIGFIIFLINLMKISQISQKIQR